MDDDVVTNRLRNVLTRDMLARCATCQPQIPCNAKIYKGAWALKGAPKMMVQIFSKTRARLAVADQFVTLVFSKRESPPGDLLDYFSPKARMHCQHKNLRSPLKNTCQNIFSACGT